MVLACLCSEVSLGRALREYGKRNRELQTSVAAARQQVRAVLSLAQGDKGHSGINLPCCFSFTPLLTLFAAVRSARNRQFPRTGRSSAIWCSSAVNAQSTFALACRSFYARLPCSCVAFVAAWYDSARSSRVVWIRARVRLARPKCVLKDSRRTTAYCNTLSHNSWPTLRSS